MSEPKNSNTAVPEKLVQQPAAPAQAPVPQVAAIKPDSLVEVSVGGQVRREPFQNVLAGYAKVSTLEGQLRDSNERMVVLQRGVELARGDTTMGQQIRLLIAQNPDPAAAADAIRRLVGVKDAVQSEDGEDAPKRAAHDPRLDTLQRQVSEMAAKLETSESRARLHEASQHIDQVLDTYPVLKETGNEPMRDMFKMFLASASLANPQASLPELASMVHSKFQLVLGGRATQQRDAAVQQQQELAGLGAGGGAGMPETASPDATPITLKDWKAKTPAVMARWNALQQKFFGPAQRRA